MSLFEDPTISSQRSHSPRFSDYLQEMEGSGSLRGSVASSQAYLVWELAERGK